jgi:hypothetical protein
MLQQKASTGRGLAYASKQDPNMQPRSGKAIPCPVRGKSNAHPIQRGFAPGVL